MNTFPFLSFSDIIRSSTQQQKQSPSTSRSPTPTKCYTTNSTAVQWAWFTVSALGRSDDDDDCENDDDENDNEIGNDSNRRIDDDDGDNKDNDEDNSDIKNNNKNNSNDDNDNNDDCSAIKKKIKATFGRLGACALLLTTCSTYGNNSVTNVPYSTHSGDVIQWCFSAMAVLMQDSNNRQKMFFADSSLSSHTSLSDVGLYKIIADDKKVDNEKTKSGTLQSDNTKSNFSYFVRAMSVSGSNGSGNSTDVDKGRGTLDLDVDNEKALPNAAVLLKAMQSNIQNEDVAEEFSNVIYTLIKSNISANFKEKEKEKEIENKNENEYVKNEKNNEKNSEILLFIKQRNKQLLLLAGVGEMLVKILIVHESASSDDSNSSPVIERACHALSQVSYIIHY